MFEIINDGRLTEAAANVLAGVLIAALLLTATLVRRWEKRTGRVAGYRR